MYPDMNKAFQHASPSRPRLPPVLRVQQRVSNTRVSKTLDRTAYAMKLAALDEDPYEYDWTALLEEVNEPLTHGPLCPSDGLCSDITLESLAEEPGISGWWDVPEAPDEGASGADTSHGQELMDQAELQPDRFAQVQMRLLPRREDEEHEEGERNDQSNSAPGRFVCSHPKCNSKSFKRKGDLTRHKKSHEIRKFLCGAQDCRMSFHRNDKLNDHIRAGHDDETLFTCPKQRCEALMTKDFKDVHDQPWYGQTSMRQCPLPRCSFFVRLGRYRESESDASSKLDGLQRHLLESHDMKGRKRFDSLLAERGYHYESASVLCPICPDHSTFGTHDDFEKHLVHDHLGCFRRPDAGEREPWYGGADFSHGVFCYEDAEVPGGWRLYDTFPRELHAHRRTILSLWPAFVNYPVWEDIKNCPGVRYR